MQLWAGDQLWDRYRVERVADCGCQSAWLAPLHAKGESAAGYFLLSLEAPHAAPLASLLAEAAGVPALRIAAQPGTRVLPRRGQAHAPAASGVKQAANSGGTPLRKTAVFGRRSQGADAPRPVLAALPFLGGVEWIGEPKRGGVAVIGIPAGHSLDAVLRAAGPLTPAQVLPLALRWTEALDAFLRHFGDGTPPDSIVRATLRLLIPDALVLQASDAQLLVCPGVPEPLDQFAPQWMSFAAPELFRPEKLSAATPVFGAARLIAACLLPREDPATPEQSWLAVSDTAAGRCDPAEHFAAQAQKAGLPAEFTEVLARALAAKPSARFASLSRFLSGLQALCGRPWARAGHPCEGCGFVRSKPCVCTCCGREPGIDAGRSSSGTARVRKNTAILAAPRASDTSILAAARVLPEGMVLIPGGAFLSGERKTPRSLRSLAIDITPVTEGDYKRYLAAAGKTPGKNGPGSRPARFDRYPVTNITWFEASAYAEHHGKRLPTLHEWEKAARGTDGRKFPYGNTYLPSGGNLRTRKNNEAGQEDTEPSAVPVGSFKAGASPYGVLDMAGNVLEWSSSARRAGARLFRAVKGACFQDSVPELARCTSLQYLPPDTAAPHLGFRCVKDLTD